MIYEFSQYRTIYTSFENNTLLQTTLGNTITSYFNTSFVHAVNSSVQVNFNCEKNIFNGIFAIRYNIRYSKNHPGDEDIRSINGKNETDFSHYYDPFKDSYPLLIRKFSLSTFFYNERYKNENNFTVKLSDIMNEQRLIDLQNDSFIIYYSCKLENTHNFDLEIFFIFISLITLIVIIIFYFLYKKAISSDKKAYQKNKIFITNYTLVLKNLKINSIDYEQEINDLISFLNDKINQYSHLMAQIEGNNSDINNLNIFDISISNVNSDKIEIFKSIKSLKNKIEDIQNDNDTIKNKLKNNVKEISHSIKNVFKNLSSKEINDEDNENENVPVMSRDSISLSDLEEKINEEKLKKIEKKVTIIKEKRSKITFEITELHRESNLNKYSNIYISFRNQLIANLIYDLYNKNIFSRLFYYIFCQKEKLKKNYYKNQWLNFDFADENPSDIKWENYYISPIKKYLRRFLSTLISLVLIVIIWLINAFITMEDREKEEGAEKKEMNLERLVKILLTQVINIASSIFLGKLTKIEKNTSITKDMISDISKYFWFNILISISIFIVHYNLCLFSYLEIEKYFYLNKLLMENVLYSVITSHFSYLFFYFWNLLKRFSDSRFNNGSTTEIKKKTKYEKIYLGPEFPFTVRYGKILSTLAICCFYGTNCPVIFFFFILFLIVIYIVDKFLMINYYKKPTFYSNFLPKKINNYFFLCIFIYFYGLIYNGSNPYLFDNSS